jgi:hypothetical protein
MATATVTPTAEVVTGAPVSTTPVTLTPSAINKVREIMASQNPIPAGGRRRMFGVPVFDVVREPERHDGQGL